MQSVNIHAAKTHLSRLIEEALARGEGFIIAKAGKPVATVTPVTQSRDRGGRIGFMRAQISVPDDFDALGRDEIEALFLTRP
jgi:antitoxin (DNA-binding transcriptional repressor) of toxin-antitoxin stability system